MVEWLIYHDGQANENSSIALSNDPVFNKLSYIVPCRAIFCYVVLCCALLCYLLLCFAILRYVVLYCAMFATLKCVSVIVNRVDNLLRIH